MPTSSSHESGSIHLSAWACALLALTIMAALLQAIAMLAQTQVMNAHSRDTRLIALEARTRACLAHTRWEERLRCENPEASVQATNVWPPHADSIQPFATRVSADTTTAMASAR